jgi:hypothetical protein
MALAAILLVPGLATLWAASKKFNIPVPPAPLPLTGLAPMSVNLSCALIAQLKQRISALRSHQQCILGAVLLNEDVGGVVGVEGRNSHSLLIFGFHSRKGKPGFDARQSVGGFLKLSPLLSHPCRYR